MNFDNLINHVGSTVTHKTVTITEADALYGTPDESFATGISIKVILTAAEDNDRLVKQGILQTGDLKATVKSDLTIAEGDVITISGTDWEVVHITPIQYMSNAIYKTAGLKKRLAGSI